MKNILHDFRPKRRQGKKVNYCEPVEEVTDEDDVLEWGEEDANAAPEGDFDMIEKVLKYRIGRHGGFFL